MINDYGKHEQKQYLTNATKDAWKRQLEFGIGLMSQAVKNAQDIEGNTLNSTQVNDAKSIIQRLQTQLDILNKDLS